MECVTLFFYLVAYSQSSAPYYDLWCALLFDINLGKNIYQRYCDLNTTGDHCHESLLSICSISFKEEAVISCTMTWQKKKHNPRWRQWTTLSCLAHRSEEVSQGSRRSDPNATLAMSKSATSRSLSPYQEPKSTLCVVRGRLRFY